MKNIVCCNENCRGVFIRPQKNIRKGDLENGKQKNNGKNIKKQQRYYPNCTRSNYSTKLLVPRNGTNVEETANIENNLNLVYNIFM